MSRSLNHERGIQAEDHVTALLHDRGYQVENLNDRHSNQPYVDLACKAGSKGFLVSVKSAWSANRQVRLGAPKMVATLPKGVYFMILLPARKGAILSLAPGGHVLWIVPGDVVRDEALVAHQHYAAHSPGSANHSVMVKDKEDRSENTRSGAVFRSWEARFTDAWHLLPVAAT